MFKTANNWITNIIDNLCILYRCFETECGFFLPALSFSSEDRCSGWSWSGSVCSAFWISSKVSSSLTRTSKAPSITKFMKFAILSLNSFSANGSTKQRSYLCQTSRKLEDLFYKSEATVVIDAEFQIGSYHFLHNLNISEFNIQIKNPKALLK